ncbi:MAG: type II toxin-antitoxin system Phd/YefM family antitoxin [Saprospiraceae bacterium]|nr:type II toxin-antitoxin system Phd/YefM family antitoxin [Saprospiraceae bacterium]
MKDHLVSISELRENLKEYIGLVTEGHAIYITRRGEVIAEIKSPKPELDDELSFQQRLKTYAEGGITIVGDIINQPLIDEDFVEDNLLKGQL